jgi:hypothetical protein
MFFELNIFPGVDNCLVLRGALRFPTIKIRVREKVSNAADVEIWAPFIGSPNVSSNLARKARI